MTISRSLFTALATTTCLVAFATPAHAQTKSYNIPAGDLADGLDAFARQSGEQIVYKVDEVRGRSGKAVRGRYDADDALRRLLSGSGFQLRRSNSGAFAVVEVGNGGAASSGASDAGDEEIVVTGTNIRGAQVASPVQTIDRARIEQEGYTETGQIFRDLPANLNNVNGGPALSSRTTIDNGVNLMRAEAVNLRGLGVGSTLTLLNGQRRAGVGNGINVDVSAIPIAAIERVDIVTGGASAIYGSDAVGGVVNVRTRRSFEGIEVAGRHTITQHNGGELSGVSLVTGLEGSSAGFVLAYDYRHTRDLNLIDLGVVNPSGVNGGAVLYAYQSHIPKRDAHNLILSGHVDLAPSLELFFDGLYSNAKTRSISDIRLSPAAGGIIFRDTIKPHVTQYGMTGGVRWKVGGWAAVVSGNFSQADEFRTIESITAPVTGSPSIVFQAARVKSQTWSTNFVADGPILSLPAGTLRGAFGAEYRTERYWDSVSATLNGAPFLSSALDRDRKIWSVFGEVTAPLIESDGLGKIVLTGAIRHDSYDDFGGSTTPQAGLIWDVGRGLRLKGNWSRAFRTPALALRSTSGSTSLFLFNRQDSDGTNRPVLEVGGADPNQTAERAEAWSVSADYSPPGADWLTLSASYFNIAYTDRIGIPLIGADRANVLKLENAFAQIIDRSPTNAQIAEYISRDEDRLINDSRTAPPVPYNPAGVDLLAAFPGLIVVRNFNQNLAIENVDGIDLDARLSFPRSWGTLHGSLGGSYVFDHFTALTPTSAHITQLDDVGKQPSLRLRATGGFQAGQINAQLALSYVGSYRNTIVTPVEKVSSWTTVNGNISWRPSIPGLVLGLSVTNLFNENVPLVRDTASPLLYDPANADPVGRVITITMSKRF